jgi:hypothetical protein
MSNHFVEVNMLTPCANPPLQQKVSLYFKWFDRILSEFIGHNEWDLVGKQWIH